MKSEWLIESTVIAGERVYAICRLIDITGLDNLENKEYSEFGYLRNYNQAVRIVEELNSEEEFIYGL